MRFAIIGMGPRGLSALEQLLLMLAQKKEKLDIEIILFETTKMAGYGHVYNVDQADSNWLNITERGLKELPERKEINFDNINIPRHETYTESKYNQTPKEAGIDYPDVFPFRSTLGKYLKERFDSIINPLSQLGLIRIIEDEVVNIREISNALQILTKNGHQHTCDEALLTIGHQPTTIGDQIRTWQSYVNHYNHLDLYEDAYPISNIQDSLCTKTHRVIALRGFGLAAIDVIRALIYQFGGKFNLEKNNMNVISYTKTVEPLKIIPFSLDGLPPVPKPYSPDIDQRYTPTSENLKCLRESFKSAIDHKVVDHDFFVEAMAKLITSMYIDDQEIDTSTYPSSDIENIVISWIDKGDINEHLMTSTDITTLEEIRLHVSMARGEKIPNLDYFAGQVWRHCQPTIYKELSHSSLSDEVMNNIIAIDERIKRYSYGPPVASMQQIILLHEVGVIDLNYIHDPKISLTQEGWKIHTPTDEINATAMINTVIDSPEIEKITSPLISNLLADDKIQAVHRKLGIDTHSNGLISVPDQIDSIPIYILGRIAKGSVIGVDAILECFGSRVTDWAEDCAERFAEH